MEGSGQVQGNNRLQSERLGLKENRQILQAPSQETFEERTRWLTEAMRMSHDTWVSWTTTIMGQSWTSMIHES